MNVVVTPHASGALGPYSQGVIHNGMLFISGQLGLDYVTGHMPDDFVGQAELIFLQDQRYSGCSKHEF